MTRLSMTGKEDEMNKQPNDAVQNESPKPPGLMPKHIQSWIIIVIAVLMLLIMWFTGGKKAPGATKTVAPVLQPPPPVEVNEAKILDLQNRIQELQKEQQAAILAQQKHLLGAVPPDPQMAIHPYGGEAPPPPPPPDPIQVERQRRSYVSLFASNVAVSYRKELSGTRSPSSSETLPSADSQGSPSSASLPDLNQLAQLLQAPIPPPPTPSRPATPQNTTQKRDETTTPIQQTPPTSNGAQPTKPSGEPNTHVLFEGTVLEAVLVNRLDGEFSGPVKCLLTTDVYSHDRQHLLIPAGTKILGEAKKVEAFGQSRLAVFFHRLIMPNGSSVNLDQFKGLNQIGETGLRDKVNNHYGRIFGASLAIGALGGVAQIGTGNALTQSSTDRMREGFGQTLARSSERILDKFLNILPTLTIREGHRVKVYLAGDLFLPEYQAGAFSPHL